MTEQTERRGLSGFALKMIALVLMVIDHVGHFLLPQLTVLRWLGRLSAPLFFFTVAEGYAHTRNPKKYLFKLYIGYLVMIVGNKLLESLLPGAPGGPLDNNIFGTFFFGVLYMICFDLIRSGIRRRLTRSVFAGIGLLVASFAAAELLGLLPHSMVRTVLGVLVPNPFMVEGGLIFTLLPFLFYVLRGRPTALSIGYVLFSVLTFPFGQSADVIFFMGYQWMMVFALPLILMYNGRRGYAKQSFFYFFYPAHIWILYALSTILR